MFILADIAAREFNMQQKFPMCQAIFVFLNNGFVCLWFCSQHHKFSVKYFLQHEKTLLFSIQHLKSWRFSQWINLLSLNCHNQWTFVIVHLFSAYLNVEINLFCPSPSLIIGVCLCLHALLPLASLNWEWRSLKSPNYWEKLFIFRSNILPGS